MRDIKCKKCGTRVLWADTLIDDLYDEKLKYNRPLNDDESIIRCNYTINGLEVLES